MTRIKTLGALVVIGALLVGTPLWRHSRYTMTMERLRDNLYLIEASGMNVAALVTDDGVVLVDTMPSGWWGPALLAKIQSVTDKPITTIINTHSHQDHIGNTALFYTSVVDVVVHENTRRHIEHSDISADAKLPFKSSTIFTDRLSLTRGRDQIEVRYFGPGHTNGDAWVVFPSLRLMHIGDLAWKDDAPSFDRTTGGSGVAYPDTLARGLAALSDVETIIVGHGFDADSKPVMSRRELEEQQRFGALLLAAARNALERGQSASEATAAVIATGGIDHYHRDRVQRAVEMIFEELQLR